jgi:hypothetical protein
LAASDIGSILQQSVARFLRGLFSEPHPREVTQLPFRPTRPDEVPIGAWQELEQSCGEIALERMLVIPRMLTHPVRGRPVELGRRVVAFGTAAVGQWWEGNEGGAVERIPLDEILAIDDRTVLLQGRFSLIGKHGRMVVEYSAAARPALREDILWLRRRMCGPEFATVPSFVWIGAKGEQLSEEGLPYKWAYMLASRDDLRIDPGSAEMIAVGNVVEIGRSRGPATGIALLCPRELVVAAEPPEWLYASRYGVDLTVVPRASLAEVSWSRGDLRIRLRAEDGATDGQVISRPLDERLVAAMRRSFGDAVIWA